MDRSSANHPVLWSVERKRLEEQKVANECMVQALQTRQRNQLNKMRDIDEVWLEVFSRFF